ncbi:MAG TPA: DUF4412 domain-containing protein [Fibrobacteria bacterium]|nr:DUF4412 domain-containing protein [Fibrobacteria bacterium]
MKTLKPMVTALLLGFTTSTRAGVTLIQSYEEIGGGKPATTNTIHLDKDRVRIDAGVSPDAYFIYRGDKKAFYTVNLKEKSYMEMTERDLDEMAAKMDDARKKMNESMAKLPPEQRKAMEAMMAKMMPGGAEAPKTVYKKIGAGGTVNGWSTDRYEGTRNGEKHTEIWTTAPKNLGIAEEDFQVIKDMGKFFGKLSKNMDWLAHADDKNGFQGMPVQTLSYQDGKPRFRSEVKEVKKESQAAALFEIPAGLTLKKIEKPQ